jgi:TolA-binding protein
MGWGGRLNAHRGCGVELPFACLIFCLIISGLAMRNEIKLALYVVLLIGACLCGYFALSSYKRLMRQSSETSQGSLTEVPALQKDDGPRTKGGYARMMTFGAVFFVSVVGLGLLIGHDVSHYMGNRVLRSLYNDEGEGISDPEYEAAEQVWADGQYLEAIGMMREYLKRNPREQHVALRIAEIYEKDLANPLAAALEYEEVLKQKLPAERWGWAAIHLCNLYGKLEQQDKSIALLRRIDAEYGQTAAAEKARKRLEDLGLSTELEDSGSQASEPAPEPPSGGVKLPPGFTLKKS